MNARLTTLILFIFLVTLVSPAFASPITANSITNADTTYSKYFIGDKIIISWTYEHGWSMPTNHKVIATFDGETQETIFHLENLTDIYTGTFIFDTIDKLPSSYNVKLNGYVDLNNNIDNMVSDGSIDLSIILLEKKIIYSFSNLIIESNVPDVTITYPLGSGTTGSFKSLTIPDLLEGIEYTISASKPNYISQSKKITLGTSDTNIFFNMIKQSENLDTSIIEVATYDLSGNRIKNANININGIEINSMLNEYIIFKVPKGDIVVIIQKDGYLNFMKTYDALTNLRLDITLNEYIPSSSSTNPNSDFAQSSNIQYVYVDLNKEDQITSDLILDNPTKTIQTLASSAINWSIILGAYLGAAFLLFIFNNMNKSTILLFGTISWVLPLIIMFIGFNPFILNYISGSDSIYYGIINFTIYGIIFTTLSKKGESTK